MKSKVFQTIAAWIQSRHDARAERRRRRALIQDNRREKRELQRILDRLTK